MDEKLQSDFDKWLDAHDDIVNMEAEEIAQMAWRAGVAAALKSVQPDMCQVCHGERFVTDQHGRLNTCTFC